MIFVEQQGADDSYNDSKDIFLPTEQEHDPNIDATDPLSFQDVSKSIYAQNIDVYL